MKSVVKEFIRKSKIYVERKFGAWFKIVSEWYVPKTWALKTELEKLDMHQHAIP